MTLDGSLDRNFGLDSLARVELWGRLERVFGVRLPEQLLGTAESPRELLVAILSGEQPGRRDLATLVGHERLEPVHETPDLATTLLEAFDWHVRSHPDRLHLSLPHSDGREEPISYAQLHQAARRVASGIASRGLERGDTVALMLPTGRDFFASFLGILYAGGVPVPIYPPMRATQIEEHVRRQARILSNARATSLITVAEVGPVGGLIRSLVESMRIIDTVDALAADGRGGSSGVRPQAHETAFLQYTSGSTGDPKGVIVSHANLLANIRAMGEAAEVTSSDVFVSWLPLYHDMGLIGAWLASLYYAVPSVILSPLQFLARPESWLWAIHRHRGTITASPNFGYELCVRRISDELIEGLDLGSLRFAANGAEPVSSSTTRRFCDRFRRYGFRPEAMAPVYGLAESAVGLTFPPPGRGPVIDRVDRKALSHRGEARPVTGGHADAVELVACGRPLPHHDVRIIDETGHEAGERKVGRLQFRGPSVTAGYFRNEAKTREAFAGDWMESGDLAYIAGGDVYLTGRTKDLIIRAGRNIYAHEVEEVVGDIPGVRKGCVAVFGSLEVSSQTERVVVLAETRETSSERLDELRRRIEYETAALLEGPPDDVVLAPPHTVLKTPSGKIRRSACRDLYERGGLERGRRALWWQVVRLAAASALPRLRRTYQAGMALAYAVRWWCAIVLTSLVSWPLVVILPSEAARWMVLRAAARTFLRLSGTPLQVLGLENLPRGPMALVANHTSYVDGLVLVAALPVVLRFVAKSQLGQQLVAGTLLRRLGAVFVERMDPRRGTEDTAHVVDALRAGQSVMFFPEGTFFRTPGVLPFKLGAFLAAAQAGVPVVPAALRGTRSILRGEQWFPRRGSVSLTVSVALSPKGSDWAEAIRLRDESRAAILAMSGEPDLAEQHVELQ
ncbi:MAG: AMP-binding protein [Myxococcota bacterium]